MSIQQLLPFGLSIVTLVMLGGCKITEPNVSYDACLAGKPPPWGVMGKMTIVTELWMKASPRRVLSSRTLA